MSALQPLRELYERDGKLTAEQVLEAANDPGSVLHRYFEWDDTQAAYRYRLDQAHGLIGRYRIYVETAPETVVSVRAFTHVGTGYVPTEVALSEHRDVVFLQAVREVSAFRRKYAALVDVDAVWSSVMGGEEE